MGRNERGRNERGKRATRPSSARRSRGSASRILGGSLGLQAPFIPYSLGYPARTRAQPKYTMRGVRRHSTGSFSHTRGHACIPLGLARGTDLQYVAFGDIGQDAYRARQRNRTGSLSHTRGHGRIPLKLARGIDLQYVAFSDIGQDAYRARHRYNLRGLRDTCHSTGSLSHTRGLARGPRNVAFATPVTEQEACRTRADSCEAQIHPAVTGACLPIPERTSHGVPNLRDNSHLSESDR